MGARFRRFLVIVAVAMAGMVVGRVSKSAEVRRSAGRQRSPGCPRAGLPRRGALSARAQHSPLGGLKSPCRKVLPAELT